MNPRLYIQLAIMMFLQYFVWGAWYVTMSTYLSTTLNFSGIQIGMAYSTLSIAAMVSPFFVGMVADRFFATERVLGVLHLIGAALLVGASLVQTFMPFYICLLGYLLCYMPTIALSNSLSFQQLQDPGKQFPVIRVLGTLGWIAVGSLIGFMNIEDQASTFQIGAGVSVLLGLYCFTLPHTPPKRTAERATVREILGLDALKLMKNVSFAVLIISSLLICIPLTFYYNFTNLFLNEIGVDNAAFKMTFGQWSELLFLLAMPFLLHRLGVKKVLMIGMACWVLRYLFFSFGDSGSLVWMLYAGIILHGICYDFFFVTGQIYVDKRAPAGLRSAAQGMITFATYGVGFFLGSWASGEVVDMYTLEEAVGVQHNWQSIWLVPAVFSAVVLVVFTVFFREEKEKTPAMEVHR
jgi:nucleoside transporter